MLLKITTEIELFSDGKSNNSSHKNGQQKGKHMFYHIFDLNKKERFILKNKLIVTLFMCTDKQYIYVIF